MYEIFTVKKNTGTYSDAIEAYGVMNLLKELQSRLELKKPKIFLDDKGVYFEIKVKPTFSEADIERIEYFPLFQYAIQKEGEKFDEDFLNYPRQKQLKDERQELVQKAYNDFVGKEKEQLRKNELSRIESVFKEDKFISPKLDVYSQIITNNNFKAFDKLYKNFFNNKKSFGKLIKHILDYYRGIEASLRAKDYSGFETKLTALQIFNPSCGKGLNKDKANGASTGSQKSSWIVETMKISGAISNMMCQPIKIGSNSWDLKVIVPDFKKIDWQRQNKLTTNLKKNIKGNTPLKVDILNLLIVLRKLIEQTEEYSNFKAKSVLNGLHSVYQKDLGSNKAVVNIAFLQTPEFIKFNTEKEAQAWSDFLDSQIQIIANNNNIDEKIGDATQALIAYRTFFTSSHFPCWERFIYWYSGHVISNLSNKKYTIPFKEKTLNQLFKNMETTDFKISEIITNDGFLKVAQAIRMSTVSLQFQPKEKRKFEVRYGVAQNLQNKSKSKKDLAEFIGEFIGIYNAEAARKAELEKGFRKPVRENELNDFYGLLDEYPSKVIGALLASYGFALTEKDKVEVVTESEIDENE